mgnify:CR=1 FL=1
MSASMALDDTLFESTQMEFGFPSAFVLGNISNWLWKTAPGGLSPSPTTTRNPRRLNSISRRAQTAKRLGVWLARCSSVE